MAISPPDKYDMSLLLRWAFQPAEEAMLLGLLEQGRQDAQGWAEDNGVAEVLQGEVAENEVAESKGVQVPVA